MFGSGGTNKRCVMRFRRGRRRFGRRGRRRRVGRVRIGYRM